MPNAPVALFDALVVLFLTVSRLTGLSYAKLNIVVYYGLIPLGWDW